ncbi:O-acetylhomoserine aminocarboxypropyltransferase/cysteine synthase family protein [Desulfomonile tiedjei]|uniref:O-acetylhomoserine sulfhydrylase n=1 Tax=Desulfomonile tiedjei (strain ATCC 49306 / DSM 6799 / DCB-1) TaxID=706587 RepID=I4C7I2_DESTA|nr:O-acetylhomoserine aminocarboxypropyltransferase/cysteine synthase family protein [Desulfomonile tiedjei]AFM25523.1 O-acetylhomoserine sulfhydrylase [Desulfomonile tiedjei DSM 6799]
MRSEKPQYRFNTLAVHGGQEPDLGTLARGVPVHRTSSFIFKDAKHASDLFSLKELGFIYTRLTNPTSDVLEKRMAALDNGVAALSLASGTSAIFYTLINVMESGDEFVSTSNLYGGTYTMFNDILPQFGMKVRFVDYRDLKAMRDSIHDKTRAIFLETIGNPELGVPDFEEISKIAKDAHIPFIVDSTFTTPYLFRPLEHGADIVIHSLTKWIGGHGTGIGGIVVDGGKFDWSDPKFTLYNRPETSYSGIRFGSDLGDLQSLAFILRMRLVPLRNLGACISPDNSWMFLQGIETLFLRMERHCSNALAVAEFLSNDPRVQWVRYPGLKADPSYANAQKYFFKGLAGGVVVFGPKGGPAKAEAFIDRLKLFSHLANVGDAKSLAIHPASTTHSQLSPEQQMEAGFASDLVRLSVGIEDIDDIIGDLDQALG